MDGARARPAEVCDIPAMPNARRAAALLACVLSCMGLFAASASAARIYRWTAPMASSITATIHQMHGNRATHATCG